MTKTIETDTYRFFNEDCISGERTRIADGSVDLIITDPPYGIEGDRLHRHYNRSEKLVLDGYIEIPFLKLIDEDILTRANRLAKNT